MGADVRGSWQLMFRVNNRATPERCVERALGVLGANVTHGPKPYWKHPELWEVTLQSGQPTAVPEAVLAILLAADALATGWNITGPSVDNGDLSAFEGVFDARSGRPHVAGLEWAWFSVGTFSGADIERAK